MAGDLARIRIVLVAPAIPENIGMAARAMQNCGLSRLVLVNPVDPRSVAAVRPAMEAHRLVARAEIHRDLAAAVAGSGMVVGTTRRRGRDRHPPLPLDEWIRDQLPRSGGRDISILFGPEKNGLDREALDRCDFLITIPAHSGHESFNLAQAVLLVSHALFRAAEKGAPPLPAAPVPATAGEREGLQRHLESVLIRIGFQQTGQPGRVLARLRRLFGRTVLDEREVRILRGILSQFEWALYRKRPGEAGKGE